MSVKFALSIFGRRDHARSSRRGTTLIEVIATLSLMMMLAVSAVRLLGSVTDVGKRNVDSKRGRDSVERLVSRLRMDVDSAIGASATQWPIRIETQTGRTEYDLADDQRSIGRTVFRDSQAVSTDLFWLPMGYQPTVAEQDDWIQLRLKPSQGSTRADDATGNGTLEGGTLEHGPLELWTIELRKP